MREPHDLDRAFGHGDVEAVVHFAGLKAVGESVEVPLQYYDNNVGGTMRLLEAMERHGVRDLVFSSSCTVYGDPDTVPITEDGRWARAAPTGAPSSTSRRCCATSPPTGGWRIALLRYFNPVGAHASGLIGEDPVGIPNNLMPYIMQVAVGRRDHLTVHGDDYPTPDGTAVRDYLHVVDLAEGHLAALRPPRRHRRRGGGQPRHRHRELGARRAAGRVDAVGRDLPYEIGPRRAGDVVAVWADPARAASLLHWRAARTSPTCAPITGAGSPRTPTATGADPKPLDLSTLPGMTVDLVPAPPTSRRCSSTRPCASWSPSTPSRPSGAAPTARRTTTRRTGTPPPSSAGSACSPRTRTGAVRRRATACSTPRSSLPSAVRGCSRVRSWATTSSCTR